MTTTVEIPTPTTIKKKKSQLNKYRLAKDQYKKYSLGLSINNYLSDDFFDQFCYPQIINIINQEFGEFIFDKIGQVYDIEKDSLFAKKRNVTRFFFRRRYLFQK